MRFMPTIFCIAAWCAGCSGMAGAQTAAGYPAKPVRLSVPWPPGGGTDVFARVIGQKLAERIGYAVVIDNRPGAAGNIGAELVAKSPADGYTIMLATITLATNPGMYSYSSWFGFFAPAATPAGTVAKLNREIVNILQVPDMKQRLTQDGADVVAGTAPEFAAYLAAETKKWAQVIRQAGIRAD